MKTKKKNSFGKRVLSTVLAVATALSGFTFTPFSSNTVTASAESVVTGQDVVEDAMKYLGYGYASGGNGSNGTFDCSGFVEKVLEDLKIGVGSGGVPETTDSWQTWFSNIKSAAGTGKTYTGSYALTYNGTAMNTIVAANYTDYISYCNNSAYDSYVIVLADSTEMSTIVNAGGLKDPGTIIIHEGHAAIGIGELTPSDLGISTAGATTFYSAGITGLDSAAVIAEHYNTLAYTRAVMDYIYDNYNDEIQSNPYGRTVTLRGFGIDGSALASESTFIQNIGTCTVGGKLVTSISNTMLKSGGHDYSYVESLDNSLYSSISNYGLVANITGRKKANTTSNPYNNDYGVGSTIWRIEALWYNYGVAVTNADEGKESQYTQVQLARMPQTPSEYYGTFSIQKTNSSGTAIATEGIKFGVYTTYSNGSVSGLVETITTDSTGLASFDTGLLTSQDPVTYYVKETSLPSSLSGYTVSSTIYKVVITPGTATDGSDSTIAVTNAATGATISTSASTIGRKFNFPNTPKTYLGQFSIQKVDDAGKKITQSGIQFGVYSTYSNGSVSNLVTTITTGTDGIATYTPSSWTAAADNSNQTKTYYVREISTGSSGTTLSNLDMTANTDIYRVKLTGSTTSAASSTITVTNMTNTSTSVTVTSSNTLGYIFYLPNEQLTEYTVTKEFGDTNTEGKVINVTVYLYADGTKVDEYVLTEADNNWSHTFTNLPMYNSNKEVIEYTSKEVYVSYEDITGTTRSNVAYSTAKTAFTISNGGVASSSGVITNTLNTTTYPVMKVLEGDAGDYIESVTFTLYANSTNLSNAKIDTVTLDDSNNWRYIFTNLDTYDYKGAKITYSATETVVTLKSGTSLNTSSKITNYFTVTDGTKTVSSVTYNTKINELITLYGGIAVTKVNSENEDVIVEGARFGVYSDAACTKLITTITTNSDGKAIYETEWYKIDSTTKTVYVKELYTPDPYVLDDTVYTVVITGSTAGTSSSTVKVTASGSSVSTKITTVDSASAQGYTQDNDEQYGQITITKYGEYVSGFSGTSLTGNADMSEVTGYTNGTFTYSYKAVAGATFALYAAEDITNEAGTISYKSGELVETLTSGSDGTLTFGTGSTKLPLGTYTLVETEAPDGLTIPDTHEWTITLTYKGQNYSVSSTSKDVYDTLGNATVSLVKIDGDTKNALEGAYYGLYAAKDITNSEGTVIATAGTLISVVKTDADGEGEFLNGSGASIDIPYGSYYIQEIQTRDGYIYSDEKYEFTFSQPGTTTYAKEFQNFSNTFTDERMSAYIEIDKFDEETGYAQGDGTLEGAVYGLYAAEDIIHPDGKTGVLYAADDLVAYFPMTDENGHAELSDLYLGKYYVKEITPSEGYLIDYTAYYLSPVSDGVNNVATTVTEGKDTYVIRVQTDVPETPIKRAFAIQKITTGEETATTVAGLDGAGFTVYLVSDLVYNADGSINYDASPKTVVNADGTTELITHNVYENGDLVQMGYAESIPIPYGYYLVHESTVPEDKLKVEDFYVTISNKDTYTDSDGNPYANRTTVQLWNYAIDEEFEAKIKIIKVDADTGERVVLSGATFKIYDVDNEEYVRYYDLDDESKTVDVYTWTTNDEGYAITSKSLPAGTYRIEEIQAPEGFYNAEVAEGTTSTITITIGTNIVIEGEGVDAYYDSQLKCYVLPVTYSDPEVRGTIEVTKSGEVLDSYDASTGTFKYVTTGLPGATYTVYAAENIYSPDNGSLIWSANDEVGTIVTDNDGYGKLENLNLGKYYIKETKAPEGYLLSDEVQYATLAYADQTVKVVFDTDGTENSFVNARPTYDISVVKYEKNEDGSTNYNTVLAGTGFKFITTTDIKNYKGETIVTAGTVLANVVTGADGKATIPTEIDLPFGSYQFIETSVPAGYVLDTTPINAVYGYQGQSTPVITVACEQANHYIKIEVSKEDIETSDPVVGAVLELWTTDENGNMASLYETWTSDGTAYRINRIPAGTYILHEVSAPGYYVCADDIKIVVAETAEVQGYTLYDDFTKVEFAKVDIETGEYVEGAVLALYTTDANGNKADLVDQWTTTTETHYIERINKGTYILSELSAPGSYVCADDMTVVVADTPVVQTFTMEDDFTKAEIAKVDIETGEYVVGAELELYKANDDGTKGEKVASWTTTAEPYYIERLDKGTYIIHETYAPDFYVISEDITIEIIDTPEVQTFTMKDDVTKAEIAKVDIETGEYVVGAELELYKANDDGTKGEKVASWTTTAEPYHIERLNKGTYIVHEVSAPDCHVTAEDITIEIVDTPEVQTFTMKDDYTKIQILKVDIETGEPVVGAVIEMYKVNDDGSRGELVDTWTTDGTAHYMERVDKGDYILIETYAPGYYVSGEFTFTVKDTPDVQTFTMKDDFTKVSIEKVDIETGEPVIGAVLSLYKLNDDGSKGVRIDTWVVEEEPYYIERLEKGDYILVENLAPGYYVTSEDMIFTVEDTPDVQTFTMKDDVTKLEIQKTDIVTGEEVIGAVLSIYKRNADGTKGELVETWTSTEEPYYIERLDKGTYILVEEYAPNEYVTAQDITFIVDDTGEIQVVEMEDDITKVLISKTDIATDAEVEGATLSIYSVDENGERVELIETWTSGTRPHYIERLVKGDYVLVEEYAPGSYVTSQDVYFTVEDTAEIQTVVMVDDFTKVEISKTDIVTGEEVEGATLTIYSVDENGDKVELIETWTTTTEPHYIERLDKGEYVLVEEYAPGSYVTAQDVYFTVEDTAEIQKVEMVDDFTKVEISKTDLTDGEDVPGATLTIYEQNEDGTRGDLVETWVTDGEPHTIERLDKGTYILVEENTPDGYQVAEEVVFEVTDTAEIQKVEMKDARTYGKVVVEKKDENGNPLAGVEFTITNKDTGEVVDVITTDENGHAESKEMPIDERQADQTLKYINYTIQETKTASADYVLDDTVTEFTYLYVDDKTPVVTYNYGATNELQKGRIAVMKKGLAAVDTTKVETVYGVVEKLVYDYIYLPGVEFTIYADEDLTEVVATITTDKDGAAYSDYLPVGTYYVVETFTPAGYVADDTVYTVNITGDGTGNLYVLDVTKDIVNHPCSVTINIYKEGSFLVSTEAGYEEKTEPLEGVVIGIYAAEDIANYLGTTVIDKDTLIAVLVTDEEGLATMTETLPAGSYYFKELKTLDNYVLDETKHEFSVSYENDNTTIEVNKENPLINYPQSGTLTVNKVDQNGNPLGAGVEFLVTCVDTGETWTIVTDANGIATLTDLSIGAYDENGTWVYYTYTLQETKTLDNYKLDDTVYTWQFTADNTNANAVSQTFTVRNVILGIVDYSAAGGAGMLMLALVLVLMAIRKKKEDEEIEAVAEVTEPSEI